MADELVHYMIVVSLGEGAQGVEGNVVWVHVLRSVIVQHRGALSCCM